MPSETKVTAFLQALVVCGLGWATILTGGCGAAARVETPLTAGPLAGNDPHDKTEFWYQLARRPAVSNDEAFHALLLYFAGSDPAKDYPGRIAELKTRKMLPANFDRPANEMIERGVVALAIARGADIKGGVTMQLIGGSERYADRALQYRGLLPAGSPN